MSLCLCVPLSCYPFLYPKTPVKMMCTEYMKGSFHMTTKPIMLSKKLYLLGKSFTEFQSSLVHLIKKILKVCMMILTLGFRREWVNNWAWRQRYSMYSSKWKNPLNCKDHIKWNCEMWGLPLHIFHIPTYSEKDSWNSTIEKQTKLRNDWH